MRTWVDASTLIALDLAGELEVLRTLLGRVSVTKEVAEEVAKGRESRALRSALGSWIEVVEVPGDRRRWMDLGLGRGEASLLLTPVGDRLVPHEVPAPPAAQAEGRGKVGPPPPPLAGGPNPAPAPPP